MRNGPGGGQGAAESSNPRRFEPNRVSEVTWSPCNTSRHQDSAWSAWSFSDVDDLISPKVLYSMVVICYKNKLKPASL